MSNTTDNLEQRLGYAFKNKNLLEQALTHGSYSSDIHRNYERLEFLGDRILGVVIAELLCKTFPDEPEGALAQRFVRLVCKEAVAEVVRHLQVARCIRTITPDIRNKINVLCDVGEAIIAAIYLDSGDMTAVKEFVCRNWIPLIDKRSQPAKDYKTALQEKVVAKGLGFPIYTTISQVGPQHEPTFVIRVELSNGMAATGDGRSKKQAEQQAACEMYHILESTSDE